MQSSQFWNHGCKDCSKRYRDHAVERIHAEDKLFPKRQPVLSIMFCGFTGYIVCMYCKLCRMIHPLQSCIDSYYGREVWEPISAGCWCLTVWHCHRETMCWWPWVQVGTGAGWTHADCPAKNQFRDLDCNVPLILGIIQLTPWVSDYQGYLEWCWGDILRISPLKLEI